VGNPVQMMTMTGPGFRRKMIMKCLSKKWLKK
jgi:hypothetical protein